MSEPLQPPGGPTSPLSPIPKEGPEGGAMEKQKPFSLPAEGERIPPPASEAPEAKSPMELAKDREATPRWAPEEMESRMGTLKDKLNGANQLFQDPNVEKKLTEDHQSALDKLVGKMTPDMKEIAKRTGIDYDEIKRKREESVVGYVTRWLDGSQSTMANAIQGFGDVKKMDPASYFKLQVSVQRATERAELFASIVGSSVSGVKTLMSMQLG